MKSAAHLAYHTVCESTSADTVLRGSFCYPGSNDVVIVKGRHLALYTLLTCDETSSILSENSGIVCGQDISREAADHAIGENVANDCLRFVSQVMLQGAPVAARLLPDFIFHSYEKLDAAKRQSPLIPSCDSSQLPDTQVEEAELGASASHPVDDDGQAISSEEVRATSALILAFDFGRVMVVGFDRSHNRFITLSMHVLDRRLPADDDEQYMQLPLRDKIRMTTVSETYMAVCALNGWFLLSHRRMGNHRMAVYGRRYIIAYCNNERLVHIVVLCTEFKRPTLSKRHRYFPFGGFSDSGVRGVDGDHHSVVTVPWLRVESLSEFDVDTELGFCEDSYFVRGMDLYDDSNKAMLGLLIATKPEAIGTHVAHGSDCASGGISFIAMAFYPEARSCTIIQRLDSLPVDTEVIVGVPPSVYGSAGFLFRSLDFIMWTTLLSPTLCWQFTAPTGLLNTCFNDEDSLGGDYRFLNAMRLNLDVREYTIGYVGTFFVLIPRSRGVMYIGRPVTNLSGILKDILWCRMGDFDFEVAASQLITVDDRLEAFVSGSGVELAVLRANLPDGFLGFITDSVEDGEEGEPFEISISEIPTKVPFFGTELHSRFHEEVGDGSLSIICFVPNSGAVRDPKNVTLPELWQVGCSRPPRSLKPGEAPQGGSALVQRFKPQRRPYAPIDRQVTDVTAIDYVWPKQQSIVGLCDDSKIVVLMEKATIQPVIAVPLQSCSTLIPLRYSSSDMLAVEGEHRPVKDTEFLLTWDNNTATVTLNEHILEVRHNSVMDRRKSSVSSASVDIPLATDERTLTYATVCSNRLVVQVTATRAIFLDTLSHKGVCSIQLPLFDETEGSTVRSVEVTDDRLICLFSSGNVALLSISEKDGQPALSVTHRISGGIVRLISLYRPSCANNAYSSVCLLVLTGKNSLFCFSLNPFERMFAFPDLTQVHPELFNDDSESLHIIDVSAEESASSDSMTVSKRQSTNLTAKRKRRSTVPVPRHSKAAVTSSVDSTSVAHLGEHGAVTDDQSTVHAVEADAPLSVKSATSDKHMKSADDILMPPPSVLPVSQGETRPTFNRWNKSRKHISTLEYVVCVKMLDVSPTDQGPTLVVFMTGRPLLVYRSYLLGGKDYVFQLFHHRFVQPLPSALSVVDKDDCSRERVYMQLRHDRSPGDCCISEPILTLRNRDTVDKSDMNYVTISYPHISAADVSFYLVGRDSKEVPSSAKPLTKSQIETNPGIMKAVNVLQSRWSAFLPPCLRLTSLNNRLRIHEYDLENVLDIDTTHGFEEARVVSLYSVVTHAEQFARYVIFLTRPGTLVLCVPGVLHQATTINGDVSIQEIVLGSDEADIIKTKRVPEITWNPLYCRLKAEESNVVQADLSCRNKGLIAGGLSFNGDFISQMYHMGNLRAKLIAVSHKNYYLSNNVIRANRNATVATLPNDSDIHEVYCGKLVAVAVRYDVNAKDELVGVLNERINLQLRQLESEILPPGTTPVDIIEPNKQICTLIQTLDALPQYGDISQPVWRDLVIVLHMGNLRCWLGEYPVEPMESVLSMTFGIIGNREYLLIGTCTNLGENVESKGDVVVVDLQPLFVRQPLIDEGLGNVGPISRVTKSPTCVTLGEYCKRIFPGAVSFLSSLNTDFDMIFRPNFDFSLDIASLGKADSAILYGSEDSRRWTTTHFSPNFGLFVHSVGPRLFVHEVSGKQFLRGAFAEVPLCVSAACVFDKYVVAGDLNMGLHFFMYRHDAMNDSRTLCKISSTVKKVDLSVVACAPLVNSDCIGLIASDYFSNLVLFKSVSDEGGRETLVVAAALRLPTRVTHFVRKEPDFRRGHQPSGLLGFTADGSIIHTFMPEADAFEFFKSVQGIMEATVPAPLGVPRLAHSRPLFTSQMAQTQAVWPNDDTILSLDVLRSLPFQSALFLETLTSKVSVDTGVTPYQLLNALSGCLLSM
ncbi:hypothetical protein X943_003953 [Babesia divergens]|uniref:Cleavage/polyadenylation specificity factor A subunit C-terminal domain-containing protein n=1 Tax=Babesia divergens TaxID=32595 RepID=A0AAD9GAV0_BABDI|nr:hypothetical protein X943_003953 [Babesia divergens]